jgi:nitrite reductase/ring-hydroxylating ferredoxin subunit/uncharacterized membrane protein
VSDKVTTVEELEFVAAGSESDLAEGQMHAAEVSGKRVLLTMVEGVPYALGAVCTHERANLDEGTLMGHEIYCPLHFSCFDVRTGEALEPPAERATTVYAVKIEDGTVFVSSAPVDPESLSADVARDEAPESAEPDAAVSAETEDGAETEVSAETEDGAQAKDGAETESGAEADQAERPAEQPRPAPARMPAAVPESVVAGAEIHPTTLHGRALERAEHLPGLESAAQSLGTTLRPMRESRAGGRLFDLLHGRITGHALHPALSDLPIGLWFGAVVLDVAGYEHAALILAVGGIIAGLAAAVTGVADWTVSDGRDRRIGLLHGILQTIAILIVTVSVVLRLVDAVLVGQILGAGGLALSMGAAYLGGHLVLGRGVMVDHTAWIRGPRQWTRALELADLPEGQPKAAQVEQREVLLFLQGHTISAMENACTHAGGPLSLGPVTDGVVKCPWHGSCFRLQDGAVVKGPASHPQPMLEARVRDGWVEVRGRGRW